MGPMPWVFAHGSLMFHHTPAAGPVPARVEGMRRAFGHPSVRNWGIPAAPAPTCCLLEGGAVEGLAFEVSEDTVEAVRWREASEPIRVEVRLPDGVAEALTWRMGTAWADEPPEELARLGAANVAAGGGPFGDALDYVVGVCRALSSHGLGDPEAERYQRLLRRRLG